MTDKNALPKKLQERLNAWKHLGFDHDIIIEASAGTGKTYALQSIVLKLLVEKKYDISNIVLVTYTEKAAGELKYRIRKILEEAGELPQNFNEATICTIHSFCKDLLAEYAFENRVPMRPTIAVNDDELRRDAVRAALKGEKFSEKFGKVYETEMAACDYKSTEDLIVQAEKVLKKRLGSPKDEEEAARQKFKAAYAGLNAPPSPGLAEWIISTAKLTSGKDKIEKLGGILDELLPDLLSEQTEMFRHAAYTWAKSTSYSKPSTALNSQKPAFDKVAAAINGWPAFVESLLYIGTHFSKELVLELATFAEEEYQRQKALSSVMTFDDMVLDASRVVRDERAKEERNEQSELLDAVRRKFRVALVDEFQDTDARQWEIFHSIFSREFNNNPKLKDKKGNTLLPGFLLVVGDPKQAIYSFRGADLKVYKAAREKIEDSHPDAYREQLTVTWRSTKELVNAFKELFSIPDWFGAEYEEITASPDKSNPEWKDFTQCDAVTLLESLPEGTEPGKYDGLGNNKRCQQVFLENAAQEIKRLRSLDEVWTDRNPETDEFAPHQAQYGDFCILVRRNEDAEIAKRILGRHGIPYGHYKEAGIYISAEAEAVLALFDFLAEPWRDGNLAALLLTPFFDVPPRELANAVESKPKTVVKLVEEWQLLTAKRKWNELFEDVLAKSALSRPQEGDFEYDRRWAAIRQIFDKLLAEIGRTATDIEEFAELLRVWRRDDSKAGDGGALRRKESDANRVQIMTMHASKGLEFPVVFVAYGFEKIDKNGATREENEENQQETRRLLYVALTRAKRHLYLPWSERAQLGKNWGVGSAGSALRGGFLSCAIIEYFRSLNKTPESCKENTEEVMTNPPVFHPKTRNAKVPKEGQPDNDKTGEHEPVALALPKDLARQRKHWDSYSSLRTVSNKPRRSIEKQLDKEDDEDHSLPGGKNAGLAFHKVMELLCGNDGSDEHPDFGTIGNAKSANELFDEEKNAPLWALVRKAMKDNSLKPGEGNSTAEKKLILMAWQALNKEFVFKESSFRLKDVPENDRRAEVEFAVDEAKSLDVTESNRDGAFNGSVDLLVRLKGVGGPYYYFLDWKTNSLSDYGESSMEEEMKASGYDLQYKIYSLALRQWLGDKRLAGYAYVFVRGIEDEGKGVYRRDLESNWEKDFRDDLAKKTGIKRQEG